MPGVLLRDHFPCEFDGASYYIREIDAARVNIPDAGEGVSIRIIPDGSLNNIQYGDTTLLLTMTDAHLLAQAILSVAFEGVRGPRYASGPDTLPDDWGKVLFTAPADTVAEPEPPDLLGPEPETGQLPADPRKMPVATFTPLDPDALERVDAGGAEGIIKAMDGGLV